MILPKKKSVNELEMRFVPYVTKRDEYEAKQFLDSEGMKQLADEIEKIEDSTIMSFDATMNFKEIVKFLRGD